MASIFLINH